MAGGRSAIGSPHTSRDERSAPDLVRRAAHEKASVAFSHSRAANFTPSLIRAFNQMQNESNRRSLSKISKLLRSARSGRFNTLSLPGLTRTARRFAVYVWPTLELFSPPGRNRWSKYTMRKPTWLCSISRFTPNRSRPNSSASWASSVPLVSWVPLVSSASFGRYSHPIL